MSAIVVTTPEGKRVNVDRLSDVQLRYVIVSARTSQVDKSIARLVLAGRKAQA